MTKSEQYFDQAKQAYDDGNFEKAIELLNKITPQDGILYFRAQSNLALIYEEQGKLDKAIHIYKKFSREHNPWFYANAQLNLARIYEDIGDIDNAIKSIELIVRKDAPEIYAEGMANLARIFEEKGQLDKAIEAYKEIHRKDDPKIYAQVQFNLAYIFSEKGEQKKAIETYRAISPEDSPEIYAKAQFNLARIFEKKGKWDEAKDAYSRVESDNNPAICYVAKMKVQILSFEETERKNLNDISLSVIKILRVLHVTFDGDTEDDCKQVAHYTRPSTALKLLGLDNKNENSNFRLSTIHGVNDPTEGRVFYRFLNFRDTREQKDNTAFISCFTFNHDSLNQFRLYGKEEGKEASGVSMVFNVKKFFSNSIREIFLPFSQDLVKPRDIDKKKERSANKSYQEAYLPLYRCVYIDPVTGYISLAKRTRITFFRENEKNSDNRWCEYQKKMLAKEQKVQERLNKIKETLEKIKGKDKVNEVVQDILLPLKYLVKHYAFEEEQECRMISIRSLVQENEKIKTDIAAKSMYVEYPIDVKNAIEKVYLSVGAREFESFFIKALGDSRKVRISDNPFRAKS
ncbi:TPA: tetratricopeptide repeat protein [Pasteurella multocida]|nr:tetratricopeptide repeat protein [Pasteurella multocida]